MGKKFDFQYIVIGSGPAGSAAALTLAKFSKKPIAIVEERNFGGTDLNTRDIPYAVALNFSHSYQQLLSLPEFKNQDITFSLPTAVSHQLKSIIETGNNYQKAYEKAGITCIKGYANFLDKHTIAIGEKKFTAANFLLATGSKLKTSGISGTESVNYLTPETAIKIRRLPKVAVIVGGGSTGCEIAEYYAELGTKVIILETANRLLPREDKEVGEAMAEYLTRELGVMVLPNCKVVSIEQDDIVKRVVFRNAKAEKMIRTDCIVLATGSEPNLDYGLENTGVKFKNSGIITDRFFQTTTKNIYAAGDCLGKESSTERANYEGIIAASNLANKSKIPTNYAGFIRKISTFPEIAIVGFNEDDLVKRDRKYKKATINLTETNASSIYNFKYGFIKLLADKNNHLLGATIVAPNAISIAAELSAPLRYGLSLKEIANDPYYLVNDYNYLIKLAAKKIIDKK